MRSQHALLTALCVVAACSSPSDPEQRRQPDDRELLTSRLGALRGTTVEVVNEGGWEIRKVAATADGGRGRKLARSRAGGGGGGGGELEPAGVDVFTVGIGEDGGVEIPRTGGEGAPDTSVVFDDKTSDEAVLKPVFELSRELAEAEKSDTAGPSSPGPAPRTRPAAPLKAGSYDDNDDFEAFVEFVKKHKDSEDIQGRWQWLDVADRRAIRVVDRNGAPVPGARVHLVDEDADKIIWRGSTYGDGTFPFYPSVATDGDTDRPWLVEVSYGAHSMRHQWNGRGEEFRLELPAVERATAPVDLDVVFLIDTTGSMGDEIDRIKATLLATTEKLRNLELEFSLRYGAVLYRDIADAYVTKKHPFTDDLAAFDKALQAIQANGGGDTPESLNQGLAVAVDGMEWRPSAAKLVFMIADAPPHMDYEGDVSYADSVQAAVARGVKVHSVAASGLDGAGTAVFRQIAQFTRGEFIFIEYGGNVAASAESHGIKDAGEVKSNNLDDILFTRIRDEIAGWGRS